GDKRLRFVFPPLAANAYGPDLAIVLEQGERYLPNLTGLLCDSGRGRLLDLVLSDVALNNGSSTLDLAILYPFYAVGTLADLVAHLLWIGAIDEAHGAALDRPSACVVLGLDLAVGLIEFAIGRAVVHLSFDGRVGHHRL